MPITLDDQRITVRPAVPSEATLVLSFLTKKAAFDRHIGSFSGTLQTSAEKIHKTLFGPQPFAYFLVAELAGQPVGFALYYFRYSSFTGQPSLWLDDLYVDEEQRSLGAGEALMRVLAQIARDTTCTHIAWTADARNTRGLKFYQRLGAAVTEQQGNVCFLTWTPKDEAMERSVPHANCPLAVLHEPNGPGSPLYTSRQLVLALGGLILYSPDYQREERPDEHLGSRRDGRESDAGCAPCSTVGDAADAVRRAAGQQYSQRVSGLGRDRGGVSFSGES